MYKRYAQLKYRVESIGIDTKYCQEMDNFLYEKDIITSLNTMREQ